MKKILLTLMATASMAASALAADVKPAIIYDLGGKFDKSFNEAAYNGAEKFKAETGIEYREFEIANDAQREQALRKFAGDGNNPIVVAGFSWAAALEKVSAEYPDTKFAIIDMVVAGKPNVKSIVFKEQEGSYLAGIMAAIAAKSNKVGFVGGMDIPLIHKFACGYVGGVKSVKPDAEVFQAYTGSDPSAWNDPVRAAKSPSRRSARAPTSSITRPAVPAWACSRQRPKRASSASVSTPTGTACSRARC